MNKEVSHKVAQKLLEIEAVSLKPASPYTWTSGLRAPIYCDNRLIMSFPKVRSFVTEQLVEMIKENYSEVEVIAGTATAGIPHAAFVAEKMNLPMIYVRSSSKKHGKHSAIEGQFEKKQKIVMIEDLISTGKSVIEAADKVKEAGGDVLGCAAIFNYKLPNISERFADKNYELNTLTTYPELVEVALQNEELAPYKEALNSWYIDPVVWSEKLS